MNDDNATLDDLPDEENDDATLMKRQHDLYLRAVNNPARHRILELISASPCSETNLLARLKDENLVDDEQALNYHLDYMLKAKCIEIEQDAENGERLVNITPGGQIVDYLE